MKKWSKTVSKVISKTVSKTVYLLLSAVLLTGCGNGKTQEGETNPIVKQDNPGYGSEESPDSINGGNGGSDSLDGRDTNAGDAPSDKDQNPDTENTGDKNSGKESENKESESGGDSESEKGDESAEISAAPQFFPMLENYRERGINLHPDIEGLGEWFCGALQNAEGKIEWFTFNPRKGEKETLIWKYTLDDNGKSWEKEAVTWTQELKEKIQQGRITIFYGEDGNYYAYYCDEGQLYHFVKQDGDSYKELIIPDWDITEEREYPQIPGCVYVAENGNIVMADQGYECYIYSGEDGKILDRFRCGWYESICVKGNELFIMKDKTNNGVLHYDLAELKPLPEITGNFEGGVRLSVLGEDLYACCPQGVFRAKKDGGIFQKILDAGKYHFSKEYGSLLNLFMEEDKFFVIYAEERGVIKKYSPREPGEEFLGSFTIYSLKDSDLILDMVAEFQAGHPEIDVFYETSEGGEGSTTATDHIRALNARILAGDGPDVLVLDGLPADSYMEKGILSDFSAVLGEEKENITPNILANYMREDKLYMLPMRFMIPMFGTSGQDISIFDSLEAFAKYCEEEEKQALPVGMPYQYFIEYLYYNFPPEFVAEDKSVSKEKIADFLELVKRVCDAENALPLSESEYGSAESNYFNGITIDSWFMADGQEVIFINMAGNLNWFPDEIRQRGGEFIGNHGLYFANGTLGINAKSEQKELAELFVKEAFSYHLQSIDSFRPGLPVHKALLEEIAKEDYSNGMLGYHLRDTGKKIVIRGYTQEDSQKMIEIARAVDTPVERNQMIYEIIRDEALSFLNGAKDKEAAAGEIANRISLYYYE